MRNEIAYDIIGIGIGPFNLGLAALAESIPDLKYRFFDKQPTFNWHPGLLISNTRLQVPFYADLVTLADPTSKFSYMKFIKSMGRIFPFAIQENNFVTRVEYNQYCRWTVSQLSNLDFGLTCESIHFNDKENYYEVYLREKNGLTFLFHGKNIVVGVGTVPDLPDFISGIEHPMLFHSADYLFKKENLLKLKNVSIVGSGQSAAEIFYDLLQQPREIRSLSWFTRADYLYPMDNTQFAYEMATPNYMNYFYDLDETKKQELLAKQSRLYKGINAELIREIHRQLYLNEINNTGPKIYIRTNCELKAINSIKNNQLLLHFLHKGKEQPFEHHADSAILATGYKNMVPEFLHPVKELINWNKDGFYTVNRNYSVDNRNSIFVQNADLQSHGFNSADLGMGPFRNSVILNTVLKAERFKCEANVTFQNFGF